MGIRLEDRDAWVENSNSDQSEEELKASEYEQRALPVVGQGRWTMSDVIRMRIAHGSTIDWRARELNVLITAPTTIAFYDGEIVERRLHTTFVYLLSLPEGRERAEGYLDSIEFINPGQLEIAKRVYQEIVVSEVVEKLTKRTKQP